MQKCCLDSRVRRGYDFGSDHRLVVTRYRFLKKRVKQRRKKKSKPKYNYKGATVQQKEAFKNELDGGTYTDVQSFIANITAATVNSIPKQGKTPTETFPWDNNSELENLLLERKKYHIKNDKIQYRKSTIRIRKLVKQLRNQHYANEAALFTEASIQRDLETAYKIAKQQSTTRRKKLPEKPVYGLKDHFERHFNHDVPTAAPLILQHPLNKPTIPISYYIGPPTLYELQHIIKTAKNGKACIDIPMEAIKLAADSPRFLDNLVKFYSAIWENREVPDVFSESEITALWKNKGSKSDCKTWRGIMLSSVFTKILATVMMNRICIAYEQNIAEGQMGFRTKRGCQDGVYCLKGVQQWCRKAQRELFCGMVDLSAAFDWCARPFVFDSARLVVGDSILIEILENMYSKTVAWLKGENLKFKCSCGVRQGGSESPVLYNCLAHTCLQTWIDRCEIEGLETFELPFKIPSAASKSGQIESGFSIIHYLAYCDDLAIFAFDVRTLERKLQILNEVFIEFGLKMNMDKTETLIFNWRLGAEKNLEEYPASILKIEDQDIKNSESFKYLGAYAQVDDSSIGDSELQYRITSGTCKFFELKYFFTNHSIALNTRVKFLYSLVRSRMCYLCQGWTITKAQIQQLQSTFNKFLRYLVNGGLRRQESEQYTRKDGTEGEFAKYVMTNAEIYTATKAESLESYINKQRSKWIGNCVRSEDTTFVKQLTFPDFFKSDKKKRGIMSTTYRQVKIHYEKELKINEIEMINSFVKESSGVTDPEIQ